MICQLNVDLSWYYSTLEEQIVKLPKNAVHLKWCFRSSHNWVRHHRSGGCEQAGFNIVLIEYYGTNIRKWEKLQKLPILSKNASNKSCSQLNFLQISQWAHISITIKSGASGLQKLIGLKYYNVLEWESGVILGLNTAKSTRYTRKCFKLFRIKFRAKKSMGAYVYLPQVWS